MHRLMNYVRIDVIKIDQNELMRLIVTKIFIRPKISVACFALTQEWCTYQYEHHTCDTKLNIVMLQSYTYLYMK